MSVGLDAALACGCARSQSRAARCAEPISASLICSAISRRRGAASRCPRIAAIWKKALAERPAESQSALVVPLQRSIQRCTSALDPVLGEQLQKSPRARPTIVQALDQGNELAAMKETCVALKSGVANNENAITRERADDQIARGCR